MVKDEPREWVPLRQLGWAFLLAWVFCVFYTNAAGVLSDGTGSAAVQGNDSAVASSVAGTLFYVAMPLAASVATLIAIVIAEPRFGSPTDHRRLIVAAPLLTAVSTPFMFVAAPDPLANALLFGAGSVATGIGSALLWVMWGAYYAVLPREKSELLAPASAVSAALIVLLVSAMDGWVSIAVAATLPLLSGLCFYLVWTPEAERAERRLARARGAAASPSPAPPAGLGRTGAGILGVFAVISIAGMLHPERITSLPLQIILLFCAVMMAVVALIAVSGPRRMSLFFLYRWMCPTLVIGLSAVILWGEAGAIAAVAASLGGRFTFCLIAQVYFANYAAAGRATPAQSSSLGWLFVHGGDLLGAALWVVLEPVVALLSGGITATAVGCIVALVTVTMLVMGDTTTFLRVPEEQKNNLGKAPTPDSSDDAASAPPPSANSARTAPKAGGAERVAELACAGGLTPRETEVLALLAQGRSIPYIRDELIISRETAATHAKHIYAKLGVHSRQELIDLVQR